MGLPVLASAGKGCGSVGLFLQQKKKKKSGETENQGLVLSTGEPTCWVYHQPDVWRHDLQRDRTEVCLHHLLAHQVQPWESACQPHNVLDSTLKETTG